MSDMKQTLEQLVLEKTQAAATANQFAGLVLALVLKLGTEVRLTKQDLDKTEKFVLEPPTSVGRGGVKLVATERQEA